jgi:uncharacterized BrkB/YihY/UPF0761 family membrane protein
VDVAREMVDRDAELGGGIMASALAYRLFIWLLPLALVAVAGLGIASDAASESPESTAKSIGLADLVSTSIAHAAEDSTRWYALIVGIPVLMYTTRGLLRALTGAHRLIWSIRLLALLLGFCVVTGLAGAVRAWSAGLGVLATLLVVAPYGGLWLLITLRLPHRDAGWTALVPGAVLFGIGFEVLQAVAAYVIGPYALGKHGTYGALGVAAALLFGLYLLSRLIVAAAVLDATLWDRRAARSG